MIFPPFPFQEVIVVGDIFRRFYSDDDSINKAESFFERTVGDKIIMESTKKNEKNEFFIDVPMSGMNMKINIEIRNSARITLLIGRALKLIRLSYLLLFNYFFISYAATKMCDSRNTLLP